MIRHGTTSKFAPWLFVLVLLAVQAITLAHEIQHDLRQHDDSSCVLHLHAKQAGNGLSASVLLPPVFASAQDYPCRAITLPVSLSALGYRTRAPPSAV